MPEGKLVVFEGLDGSGKTETAANFYERMVDECGESAVVITHEPDEGSEAGDFIRAVLREDKPASDWALALAFALNRLDHARRVIQPALDAGKVVICDRYVLSSLVYQQAAGITATDIRLINRFAPRPFVTFFLDAAPEVCAERLMVRGGRAELFEATDRLRLYRERYLAQILKMEMRDGIFCHIDADGAREEVLEMVMDGWEAL